MGRHFNPHPLWRGRLLPSTARCAIMPNFNPHPLWRGRRGICSSSFLFFALFQSTPSVKRATNKEDVELDIPIISIHTLCEEGDINIKITFFTFNYFNPHPLWRGRPGKEKSSKKEEKISIHTLCEEGDKHPLKKNQRKIISIHTLCEEGDQRQRKRSNRIFNFNPHPLWRGRRAIGFRHRRTAPFQSTPSVKRATLWWLSCCFSLYFISIHTLCEEGDASKLCKGVFGESYFNPHPLWRGRRLPSWYWFKYCYISIHTLCEEGDTSCKSPKFINPYFNPHPLWRGRQGTKRQH